MTNSTPVTPFDWPSGLCGNSFTAHDAHRELILAAWNNNTWNPEVLALATRRVLNDQLPILVASLVKHIDSPKVLRTLREDVDQWLGFESVWHLNWFFEDKLMLELIQQDSERFLEWLLRGMEHLWVCVSLLGDVTALRSSYPQHFWPAKDGTIASAVAERFLSSISRALPLIAKIEDRIAVASGSTGLVQVPATTRFGMICDLLLFTGRATARDMAIMGRPLAEVYDLLLEFLNRPAGKASPMAIPQFRLGDR